MLLYRCISLNIARNSGHLFEEDVGETEKAQKRVTSAIRATEVAFKERLNSERNILSNQRSNIIIFQLWYYISE